MLLFKVIIAKMAKQGNGHIETMQRHQPAKTC